MEGFTRDEISVLCIYDVSKREGLILSLESIQRQLDENNDELRAITDSAIAKLKALTDEEFDAMHADLVPDWGP